MFKAFQFHLMSKTDLHDGTTAVEKEMLLKEHLRARTGHNIPHSIGGLVVFCDRSLFSQPPDRDGLVSIEVLGYVQAKRSTFHNEEMDRFGLMETSRGWFDGRR